MFPRMRTAACLSTALLLVPALATTGASAPVAVSAADVTTSQQAPAGVTSTLDFEPKVFVGGQRLTFTGHIGATGRRVIRLQMHLNRPGDDWITIDGFKRRTRADGSFQFDYVAPSMRDKRMRVRGKGGYLTPALTFNARSQDLVLETSGGDLSTVAGQPFDIRVDTTPEVKGRQDLPGPVFEGRALTLQRREINPADVPGYQSPWVTLSEGQVVTDSEGIGVFRDVPAPGPGAVVYRVRQEDWTRNGDNVGWFPSFPTCVDVRSPGSSTSYCDRGEKVSFRATREQALSRPQTVSGGGSTTAGIKYGWAPALWDFGWSKGEDLDTPPQRGRDAVGHWLDWSNGTGRAATQNGQLMLDSQRDYRGVAVSRGSTMATLQDNPMRYGRWEVRLRAQTDKQGQSEARTRIELVPADPADHDCGSRTITVVDYSPLDSSVRIGAREPGGTEWHRSVGGLDLDNTNHAWGIEVARGHLTWFREGKPIGTVRTSAAVPDVPMTLRLSIVGQGDQRINKTQTYYDWMRGYSMKYGRQVTKRVPALTQGSFTPDPSC